MIFDDYFADVSLEPHAHVVPAAIATSNLNDHSQLYAQNMTLTGIVQDIYPPAHPRNRTKIQYEYLVAGIGKLQTHNPMHCYIRDKFGGFNDFEVFTLKKNQ